MTTLDERELHRQEFLKRFMPDGYLCAHDVYMDWKPPSFYPSIDSITEIFREYARLLDETPQEIPNRDDLESSSFNDANELILAYLHNYLEGNELLPSEATEIAQKIDRLLLPHEQADERVYYVGNDYMEVDNDDYHRFNDLRKMIRRL